jgi:hypothetical protein
MNKIFGAVLGFFIVKLFLLSEIEQMGFRMFVKIISGESTFGNQFSIERMLLSDTSLKLIAGTIAGAALVHWCESLINIKKKVAETQDDVNNDASQPLPHSHVKCPDCREKIRKAANLCRHCGCKLIPQI